MGELTFYFDRNFGRRFPEAIAHAVPPFAVEFHHNPKSRFPANTSDDVWLANIGEKGWIIFSHDRKFHEDAPAVYAIKQHGIGCFYLWGAEATTWEKLCSFVRAIDHIVEAIGNTRRPFVFDVSKNGRLTQVELP